MKHPECSHCRHKVEEVQRADPNMSPEELVLYVLGQYKRQPLSRADIRKATGFTPIQTIEILRKLIASQKVAYSGTSMEARSAKFKLFGYEDRRYR